MDGKRVWLVIISFIYGLALNLAWEFLHSKLYTMYMNGEITNFILIRAAFVDAIIIAGIVYAATYFKKEHRILAIAIAGIIIAAMIEVFALKTGRWGYNDYMPLIPLINIGLSPFVQLAVTGCLTYVLARISVKNAPAGI